MSATCLLIGSPVSTPNGSRGLEIARTLAAKGGRVAIVLLQDAVLAATSGMGGDALEQASAAGVRVYVLNEDLGLRGYRPGELRAGVQILDYPALVDLMTHDGTAVRGVL